MSNVAELKTIADVAAENVKRARADYARATQELRQAILDNVPRTADDYRLRIVQDDAACFTSEKDMLEQVFGDFYTDEETGEYTESAAEYVEAWTHGRGIYSYGGILERKDPVTGEWEHEDSCFGFYSIDGCAPEDDIVEQVLNVPSGVVEEDVEIVYGDD